MKIELTPEAAEWVQGEVESGRFSTVEEVLRHAISAAKLARLRTELSAAESEGGDFSGEEVRRFVREHLDSSTGASVPDC